VALLTESIAYACPGFCPCYICDTAILGVGNVSVTLLLWLLVASVRRRQGGGHNVGPNGRPPLEAPIGMAQFVELIAIDGQTLDRDPVVPVGHKAPGLISHKGMRQPVVKGGTGTDFLMGQAGSHTRGVETEKKRQKIEIAPARRIGGQGTVKRLGVKQPWPYR
jgi:hypothetical protein